MINLLYCIYCRVFFMIRQKTIAQSMLPELLLYYKNWLKVNEKSLETLQKYWRSGTFSFLEKVLPKTSSSGVYCFINTKRRLRVLPNFPLIQRSAPLTTNVNLIFIARYLYWCYITGAANGRGIRWLKLKQKIYIYRVSTQTQLPHQSFPKYWVCSDLSITRPLSNFLHKLI